MGNQDESGRLGARQPDMNPSIGAVIGNDERKWAAAEALNGRVRLRLRLRRDEQRKRTIGRKWRQGYRNCGTKERV